MVLDRLLTLNSDGGFSRVEYDSLDLGTVEPDLRKRLSYVPPIGNERDKWLVNLTLQSPRRGTREILADQLVSFIRRYKRFVFSPEYKRYPDRVFLRYGQILRHKFGISRGGRQRTARALFGKGELKVRS